MYSIVMVAAMTAAPETPDFFFKCGGCHGCQGYSCGGCCGGYSCGGCCGGYSCGGCCGGYGCGGCWGCHGFVTTHSCMGCSGCYGCYGGYAMGGCCGGYAVPAATGVYVAPPPPGGPSTPAMPPMKDGKGTAGEGISAPDVPIAINSLPSTRGQVVVRVPADAKLFADGKATTLGGAERVFQTPELTSGRDFQYTLKVEIPEGTETKTVSKQVVVRAGHRTVVDFTAAAEAVTSSVTVNLPANSKLYVDGVATSTTGGTHTFKTPELTRGKAYVYKFSAEVERDGKTEVESREVTFKAGEPVNVNFIEPAAIRTASR
jgi:uncharacterized protein (TIGR03000 family)